MDTLPKYKNKSLFEVPDSYFEKLQHDVMQRITIEKKQKTTTKKWISAVSVAASIAIIITLTFFVFDNRDSNEHFYVHEEINLPEDSILTLETNQLVEIQELPVKIPVESASPQNPALSKSPEPASETIVYRAVDYYLDDFTVDSFCEIMYELECFYDY